MRGAMILAGVVLGARLALAVPQDDGQAPPMPPFPPPEAFAACANLSAGSACVVTDPQGGKHAGFCDAPSGKPLACVPHDLPPPPPPPPSQGGVDPQGDMD